MKAFRQYIPRLTAIAAVAALLSSSCSTTRRIPDDEMLYTGKKMNIEAPVDEKSLPAPIASKLTSSVDVAPNNYWKLLGWRYPFPLGLWVYNNWPNPPSGLRHWLYEKLARDPVLVSDVRPEVRTHMLEQILDNNGYFSGKASYELKTGRNPKKAKIVYNITPGPAYPVDTVILMPDTTRLAALIDSIARQDSYLMSHMPRYSADSLSVARTRITNVLRNKGYYFFRPEYIEYLADSLTNRGRIALHLVAASNIPAFARQPYKTGKVTMYAERNQGGGKPDTINLDRATLIQMQPSRLRHKSIEECLTFRPGRTFSVRNMDRTQTYLSRLGIFNTINIDAYPDTANHDGC